MKAARSVAKVKEPLNPFYVLVVVVGMAFVLTTFAYGTMAYRAVSPKGAPDDSTHSLMALVDRYGVQLLVAELGVLALATFGAMWLDGRRTARAEQNDAAESDKQENGT